MAAVGQGSHDVGKEWGNVSWHDRYYLSWATHCLSNAVSIFCCVFVINRGEEKETETQGGNTQGRSPLCDTVWARAEEGFVQSGQLRPCDNARGGKWWWWCSGGWVWQQQAMLTGCHTCFQQHYLIVLTQLHEAIDALGELHHILNGLCYFDSTQLPHDFSWLKNR